MARNKAMRILAAKDVFLGKLVWLLEEELAADRIDERRQIFAGVLDGLREMGLFGIKIQKEYGGLKRKQVKYNRIIQVVASHCASIAVLLSAHQRMAEPQPLKIFGT